MNKRFFEPLDPILVRTKNGREPWTLRLFSHYGKNDAGQWRLYTVGGMFFGLDVIDVYPFNKETRYLLGTTKPVPPFMKDIGPERSEHFSTPEA